MLIVAAYAGPTLTTFEEPLIPAGSTSPAEDKALVQAAEAYQHAAAPDDFRAVEGFLSQYPRSPWRVSLLANLGLSYYHYGYFSKAIDAWEQSWREGKSAQEPRLRALVDRAVGELARMHARLGHSERLAALFQEIGDRPVTGPATETLQGAREGLWLMQNEPGVAYLCGPMALKNLLLSQGAPAERVSFLDEVRSGPRGVSLAQVADLAAEAKLPYRLVHREAGQAIPVPSIVHWKVTHFAALIGEENGQFHIIDPTFGQDLWVTRAALESESSGYFLISADTQKAGWRTVASAEAANVRGMGNTGTNEQEATWDRLTAKCRGMCGYMFHEMLVSIHLSDTPVGYAPPKGPPVFLKLNYNQREANQPANFTWSNVSPKWTLNWLAYIQDDPGNARANVIRYAAGGGSVNYIGFNTTTNAYTRETLDASQLVRTSTTPIAYERRLANGAREVYAQSNGATTNPRRVFLTQLVDPAGNTLTFKYDSSMRLMSVTDASFQTTTLAYTAPGRPLLITKVTDPFGRSATLDYDASGRLIQITDVLGLKSQFTYDAAGLINAMTTAYGTTKFAYGQTGTTRFAEVTDPLGYKERVEFRHAAPGIAGADVAKNLPKNLPGITNAYMEYRNTFYWDKHLYASVGIDYTKARLTHWDHSQTNSNVTGHTRESIKYPSENRIWFSYPGQASTLFGGALDKANNVARVLDDGTTQLTHIEYNALGHVTRRVDPAGRETQFEYDPNLVDLLRIKQKTGPAATAFSTIAEFTYNAQHLPLTFKDASGQTTTYQYNIAGEPTQLTNALGQITRFEYDAFGKLQRIVNPFGQTALSFTYDPVGRVSTRADSEGRTVSFTYDALDRITAEAYPDGSTREYLWDKLDLIRMKDRQSRITTYTYDALRNLTETTDPAGRTTKFAYYENGVLKSVTDPNGKTTNWDIDMQNRVVAKHLPDGTSTSTTYEGTTSRVKTKTDAAGQKKNFTYTVDDQIAAIDYQGGATPTPGVKFTYDPYFRRIATMADGAGTTQYQYQPPGSPGALLLAQEDGPYQNDTIAYQYDQLNRMIARTVDNAAERFAYDNLGRVTSHTSPLGVFDQNYLGQTSQWTSRLARDSGLGTQLGYESNTNDRRLASIAHSSPARGYQYDTSAENTIRQITEVSPDGNPFAAQTWNFAHDDTDRLTQAVASGGAQYGYRYDPADNIMSLQKPEGEASAAYDGVNQLTDFNGQPVAYDSNGNLLADADRIYQWDAENRLVAVASKAQPDRKTAFRYDGLGRRIAMISPDGVETRYLWCGERLCQSRDATDVVSRRYYTEGELTPTGARLYYATDHLGSARDLISLDDGSRVASFDYDPYGAPTQTDGAVTSDFRYARMLYHPDTGLYLTRYRVYDPRTGRWLSRDPAGESGGSNLYSYADDSPVAKLDPKGDYPNRSDIIDIVDAFTQAASKELGPWAGPVAKALENFLAQGVYAHYARNDNNVEPPLWYAQEHWRELPPEQSIFHRMNGGNGNRKFVSPNGKCEVVYKPNGQIESDPLNMGTYNFFDPADYWGIPHFFSDMLPYFILGNTPEDMWTTDRWQALANLGWDKINSWATDLGALFDNTLGIAWEP